MMVTVAATPYQLKDSPYSSHSLLLASLPPRGDGRRVLDVGCAGGYLGAILASRDYRVTGIDSPCAGRAGFPESIDLLEADLDQGLPPLTGRFDFVICADVLEHLRRPIAAAARFTHRADARRTAGRLASQQRPRLFPLEGSHRPLSGRRSWPVRPHAPAFLYLAGWLDLFQSSGFRIETQRCSGVPIGLALPKWEGRAPVRAMERMSYESARLWKKMFAYQFIVTAAPESEA